MQVYIENQYQSRAAAFGPASSFLYFSFQWEAWLPLAAVNILMSSVPLYVAHLTPPATSLLPCPPRMSPDSSGPPSVGSLPDGFLTELLRKDRKKNFKIEL